MSSQRTFQVDRYCFICNKSFSRPNELRRHLTQTLKHNDHARRYPCQFCDKVFTQKSNLPQHLRTSHGFDLFFAKLPRAQPPRRRKGDPPAKAKRGKRLARKNIRREASSSLSPPWTAMVSTLSLGVAQGSFLDTMPALHSTGEITPFEFTDLGEGPSFFDGSMGTSDSFPMSEAVHSASSSNFDSSGSSSSTPMMSPSTSSTSMTSPSTSSTSMTSPSTSSTPMTSPSTSSFGDARELDEIERDFIAYFEGLGLHLASTSQNLPSFNAPGANGVQYPIFSLQAHNNINGSFVPDQPWADPLISSCNDQLLVKLSNDVSGRRNFLQNLYSQQEYCQQAFCQQEDCPQQEYSHIDSEIDDQLSPECLAALSEINQPPPEEQPQPQQQVQWSPNMYDGLSPLLFDAPY